MSLKLILKKILGGCFGGCLTLLFIVVMVCLVGIIYFFLKYEDWERENKEVIQSRAVSDITYSESKRVEIDRRVEEFNTSTVQREVLSLDCDMVNLIFEDIAQEHWGIDDANDIGVDCNDREFDVYVKVADMWWGTVKIWQRAEGEVDFAVYDMSIGPFSLAGITWGGINGAMSEGIGDAIEVMTESSYTGRVIEEAYMDEDGFQLIGVRQTDDTVDGG